jgi:hypothetical protein
MSGKIFSAGNFHPIDIQHTIHVLEAVKDKINMEKTIDYCIDYMIGKMWEHLGRQHTAAARSVNFSNSSIPPFTIRRDLTIDEAIAGLDKAIAACRLEYNAAMNLE